MIVLFTDFSLLGPFVGQLKSAIFQVNPSSKILDLMHDAPVYDIKHSAYLLSSLIEYYPIGTVFCCVVDPGVGTERRNIVVKADANYYVGPDNGLFEYICRTSTDLTYYKIIWRPERLSSTFHGRDIYAPVAAQIEQANLESLEEVKPIDIIRFSWPNDLYEVIYIDHFGNLMTGIRATSVSREKILQVLGVNVCYAETYAEMPENKLCWYVNSNRLVEIGLPQDNAAVTYSIRIGESVGITDFV